MRLASSPGCDSGRLPWGHQRREGWRHDPAPKPGGVSASPWFMGQHVAAPGCFRSCQSPWHPQGHHTGARNAHVSRHGGRTLAQLRDAPARSLPTGCQGWGYPHGHGPTTASRARWRWGQDGDGVPEVPVCVDVGCPVVPTPLRPSPSSAGGPSPELTMGSLGWNGAGWGHGAVPQGAGWGHLSLLHAGLGLPRRC